MTSNKNQHFVPRCLLRPFTQNAENLAINLYAVEHDRLITGASVKKQCSGNYFYGQDARLEHATQFLETSYGTVRDAVQAPKHRLDGRDRAVLLKFWLFQYMRTEAASRRFMAMSQDLHGVAEHFGAPKYSPELKAAVQVAMHSFVDMMDVVDDLDLCLIRNRSPVPFVISDDPAVMANRWHQEEPRARSRSFALGSSGILCLLPISPSILALAYDGDVYSLPHNNGWLEAERAADIVALNQHQFLNCRATVFVGDARLEGEQGIRAQWAAAAPRRPAARHATTFAVKEAEINGYERYRVVDPAKTSAWEGGLIRSRPIHPRPSAWPRFLKWRTQGIVYSNQTAAGFLRPARVRPSPVRPFVAERARQR